MTDDLPEFLKRQAAPGQPLGSPRATRRRRAPVIPYPRGGYWRLLRANRRPADVSEATWQACRDSIADRAARMERLRELRGLR